MTMSRLGFMRASKGDLRDSISTDAGEEPSLISDVEAITEEKDQEKRPKSSKKEKGKPKTGKGKADVPDRECIVQ